MRELTVFLVGLSDLMVQTRAVLSVLLLLPLTVAAQPSDAATPYLVEAQRLQQAGRNAEAAQAYASALALKPANPQAYLSASRCYEKLGRLQEALAALKIGLEIAPKNFSLQVETGFIYVAQRDYARGAEHFATARAINPASADNVFNLGNAHLKAAAAAFQRESWQEALAHVEKAQATGQRLPRLNYLAGKLYFQKRDNKKALQFLSLAANEEPAEWEILFDLGLALSADARWKDAGVTFARVAELNPGYAPAYLYQGRALHEQNMSEKSLALFEKALQLDPTLRLAHYHLGFALKGLAQYDNARKELLREIEINPDYSLAYFELGLIAVEKGSAREGLDYFRKALARPPAYPKTHYEIAKVLSEQNNYPESIAAFQAYLKLEPTSLDGHYGLYRALQRSGRQQEAEKTLAEYNRLVKAQRP